MHAQGTGSASGRGEGRWSFGGGTGKLQGLKGKCAFTVKGAPNGRPTVDMAHYPKTRGCGQLRP